jgi:hypothetical protein
LNPEYVLQEKLYDPKAKYKSCHTNLNKLRVRLATSSNLEGSMMTSDQRTKLELGRCYLFANRSHKVKLLVVLLGVMSSTSLFEWKLSGRGLNADSLGGMRTREQSLLVASPFSQWFML